MNEFPPECHESELSERIINVLGSAPLAAEVEESRRNALENPQSISPADELHKHIELGYN